MEISVWVILLRSYLVHESTSTHLVKKLVKLFWSLTVNLGWCQYSWLTLRYLLSWDFLLWRWYVLHEPLLLLPVFLFSLSWLEVIITIASGFISFYSHNNMEKQRTDSGGVMYYPVWGSYFIMTSNAASSFCHHPFLLCFSLCFLPHSPLSTLYYQTIGASPQPGL